MFRGHIELRVVEFRQKSIKLKPLQADKMLTKFETKSARVKGKSYFLFSQCILDYI